MSKVLFWLAGGALLFGVVFTALGSFDAPVVIRNPPLQPLLVSFNLLVSAATTVIVLGSLYSASRK